MLPVIFTAAPDNFVGEKRARFAASTAASRSEGGPDLACAEITLPLSSTTTSTSTVPDVRERRAISGYAGTGRLKALPLRTPPDMGLRILGAGASLWIRTLLESATTAV